MTIGWAWPRSREAARVTLTALLAVTAAYQYAPPLELDLGPGLLPPLLSRDAYPSEGDFRWTRARSQVVLPDPGPGRAVLVEAVVAGWRPPREPAPLLVLRAGRGVRRARPGQGPESVHLETRTSGLWSSDLTLALDSETFVPGGGDSRALGVKLHAVRVLPLGPRLAPRRPPLRQVFFAALAALLAFGLLLRLGLRPTRAAGLASLLSLAAGVAYVLARLHAALAVPALAVLLAAASLAAEWAPGSVRGLARLLAECGRAAARAVRLLRRPASAGLALAGALAVAGAYQRTRVLEIPVGGGREALYADHFMRSGSDAGRVFRQAGRGARLDLRDLGGGSPWRLRATLAAGRPLSLPILKVGEQVLVGELAPAWKTVEMITPRAPTGWRSGLLLELPAAAHPAGLRVAHVRIERDAVHPSLRVIASVVGSVLLAAFACAAAGLAATPSLLVAGALLAAETAALALDPVLAIPFAPGFLFIAALGSVLAMLLGGAARLTGERGLPTPPPAALAAAALGFVFWLAATISPLYRGGNFLFHSNVAEELWRGAFLSYYLPYPGSMLSHQAQWGNVLVPHPFLYQLLVAPLAALPPPWFHHAEKAVLALFLALLALTASLLAQRGGGARAGALAGLSAALLFPSYLLLGLGHLMTLFGCLALSLALAFLTFRFERLRERASWWSAVALLTFCFLSYTASLLFGVFVLGVALPFLWRRQRGAARALASALLAAAGLAFVLYYANWAWPFLRDSLPRLLAGGGAQTGASPSLAEPLWPRLARIPAKLADSYGSALVPLAGIAGLAGLARATDRIFLWTWAAVLVVFSGVDVFFNLLLKHHYATMVPVSAGLGLLLGRMWGRGSLGRGGAVALLLFVLWLGVRVALDTALGRIP